MGQHGMNGNGNGKVNGCGRGEGACGCAGAFADKVAMQHKLFAQLSDMFGKEVPMYDKSLLVNRITNTAVCDLLSKKFGGFAISPGQLEKTSGERHGAIRIGRPDEYRWIARFFAQFAMEPHNYYDMTSVGAKSQPIVATAFRSRVNPEHRVFSSLLQTDYFAGETRTRIEKLLATRQVFSDRAKELIEKGEREGGLNWDDAQALIKEGTDRIFKWTAKAHDHNLYKELCDGGFKIAADIACFRSHHLNHLTPNTLCMDLYTAAMQHTMGQMDEAAFRMRATRALTRLKSFADRDWMRLHFRHLSADAIAAFSDGTVDEMFIGALVAGLVARFKRDDVQLSKLKHAGFKDFTEGPSEDTPVLLRQDAYKALTEAVEFTNPDGSIVNTVHTARFGEIEQRFYATTPKGRELYDKCLSVADAAREKDPSFPKRDYPAYEAMYAEPFKAFPKTMRELLKAGLIYGRYSVTLKGMSAAAGSLPTDRFALVEQGYVRVEGLRYEDFLPVSAAGIFASNLNQYGTKSTAAVKPEYTQAQLEAVMGLSIINTDEQYAGMEAASLLEVYAKLGLLGKLSDGERASLERAASKAPQGAMVEAGV
ncbi:MAG TPA: DUF1338 family protein [Phycisphaerales bacterium]|nr:DUF1338 family protein [Phycisphaerales bacterium]